jgi:alkylglycerol monooxygenase
MLEAPSSYEGIFMAAKVILFATPVFFLLIALELAWGIAKGRNTYRLNDAINSISLGVLSQVTAIFGRGLRIGMYTLAYHWTQPWAADFKAFWSTPAGWALALIFYDFCYYWLHRMGHESALLWAAHVVHHQSQDYNLSTALRQTSTGFLLGWIFYLPMALLGVPPEIFAVVALIDLLYQFWVHTEHIGKLGWFDRVFCSPSNHRVHHAINDRYLDRNYGGILVIWDRLFGSFQEEDEACVYGTRSPLNSWNPIWANLEVYVALAKDAWRTRRWQDKLLIWVKPPGWKPADLMALQDSAPIGPNSFKSLSTVRQNRYDPAVPKARLRAALAGFVIILAGATVFLDQARKIPFVAAVLASLVLVLVAWLVGRLLEPASHNNMPTQAFKNSSLPPNQ